MSAEPTDVTTVMGDGRCWKTDWRGRTRRLPDTIPASVEHERIAAEYFRKKDGLPPKAPGLDAEVEL